MADNPPAAQPSTGAAVRTGTGAEEAEVVAEDEVRREAEAEAEAGVEGLAPRTTKVVATRGGKWAEKNGNKRQRNQDGQEAKRRKLEDGDEGVSASPFSKEEIEAEGRKPKRKVAVMIGYAGSGYKGMQINAQEKTIEGDLFKAFVAAGAISKANADDPKKSSLVRCARTDKGVHAAGNVISLKLIVEEPDIVQKINENLPPQIRVWGLERTNGSFSCYQTCDSRWYEYLIPTYSFLPPHPQSFLGKKLVESAEKEGVFETYQSLQEDVASFWAETEEKYVKPILDELEPELREAVMATIHSSEEENPAPKQESVKVKSEATEELAEIKGEDGEEPIKTETGDTAQAAEDMNIDTRPPAEVKAEETAATIRSEANEDSAKIKSENTEESKSVLTPLEAAVKQVKAAYIVAKKAYRISSSRKQRVQEALDGYVGTKNFHNYTIQKTFSDPSAKRVIRSFKVRPEPVIVNDTEWLSLKVHGQSFMMHQIRKMVAMVALIVRCGSSTSIMQETYGPANISIPKAPSLGLLLERPVFDTYNQRAVTEYMREKIDFDKYEKEMNEFKQREIYDRLYREEERDHQFHAFFHHIDHFKTDYFLWITASGISAAKQSKSISRRDEQSDDEADINGEEG
ncbi:related to tRNA-pseudouridine synthase I [Phialocephala subalpina]|uniref:tRNA pseudouridine synthase 1 n=1 Tax=Phialocephala subalpina TaxID=576137 RepID=A0A1L7XQD9_9HELO|nr:related to tRNA-pseudouridine synthase I [Phialocephala subalpina]